MKLLSSCAAALAFATAAHAVAVADVLNDISLLCTRATNVNNAVAALGSMTAITLPGILSLHNTNVILLTQVVQTTSDSITFVPAPATAANADAICSALTLCTAPIASAFLGFATIAPAVLGVPLAGPIVKQDLINLDSGFTALEGALSVKLAPSAAALTCLATFQSNINPLVDAAVAAY